MQSKIVKPTAITNMEKKLGVNLEDHLWKSFFVRNRQYSKNRFFRLWQFKLLHGKHNHRKNLKKWKITENDRKLQEIHTQFSISFETKINLKEIEFLTGIWDITNEDKNLLVLDKLLYLGRMFTIKKQKKKDTYLYG